MSNIAINTNPPDMIDHATTLEDLKIIHKCMIYTLDNITNLRTIQEDAKLEELYDKIESIQKNLKSYIDTEERRENR